MSTNVTTNTDIENGNLAQQEKTKANDLQIATTVIKTGVSAKSALVGLALVSGGFLLGALAVGVPFASTITHALHRNQLGHLTNVDVEMTLYMPKQSDTRIVKSDHEADSGHRQLSGSFFWATKDNAYCSAYAGWKPRFWKTFWSAQRAQAACLKDSDCSGVVQSKVISFLFFKCTSSWDRKSFNGVSWARTYYKQATPPTPAPNPGYSCQGFKGAGASPAFPFKDDAIKQIGCEEDDSGVSVFSACSDSSGHDPACYASFPTRCHACFEEGLPDSYTWTTEGYVQDAENTGHFRKNLWGSEYDGRSHLRECFDMQLGQMCAHDGDASDPYKVYR